MNKVRIALVAACLGIAVFGGTPSAHAFTNYCNNEAFPGDIFVDAGIAGAGVDTGINPLAHWGVCVNDTTASVAVDSGPHVTVAVCDQHNCTPIPII
jgi:hypothetical protein